jgi:hypothetical protein
MIDICSMMVSVCNDILEKDRLSKNCVIIDCNSESAFRSASQAMFYAEVPKLLDCGIEIFYQGKKEVVCVKWNKDKTQ